jgi:hypothetical protein
MQEPRFHRSGATTRPPNKLLMTHRPIDRYPNLHPNRVSLSFAMPIE